MNKSELIAAVAEKSSLSKKDTEKFLDAMIDTIKDTVKVGGSLTLVGFGKFEAKKRAARIGRNPRTGEAVRILERRAVSFKAGKALMEHLNRR